MAMKPGLTRRTFLPRGRGPGGREPAQRLRARCARRPSPAEPGQASRAAKPAAPAPTRAPASRRRKPPACRGGQARRGRQAGGRPPCGCQAGRQKASSSASSKGRPSRPRHHRCGPVPQGVQGGGRSSPRWSGRASCRPVGQRIGQDPLVIKPVHEIGKYGGTWRPASAARRRWNGFRIASGPDHLLFWDYTGDKIVPNIARG